MTAPLRDTVVGYRTFVVKRTGRLYSQYSDAEWPSFPDATFTARCEEDRYQGSMPTFSHLADPHFPDLLVHDPVLPAHDAPHPDCGCGIHAFYEVGAVNLHSIPWDGGEIIGALVVGWGDLVPHPDGFRCSHARICALSGRSAAARLAAENCEVELVDRRSELTDLAPLFGSPFPDELKPDPDDRPRLAAAA